MVDLDDGLKVTMMLPDFIKDSQEVKKLKRAVKILNGLKDKAIEKYKERSLNLRSRINTGINKLFQVAFEIDCDEVVQCAYFRTRQGYPPRKGNRTFGDAIIWEALLEYCADDNLVIVSNDSDYREEEKSKKIHSFLESEWYRKTSGKTVKLYRILGDFINDNSPRNKKPINKELIEKDLQQLYDGFMDAAKPCVSSLAELSERWNADLGITQKICDCCGQNFQSNQYSFNPFIEDENKCSDCAGPFAGVGKTCRECGKHYHDGLNYFSSITLYDVCPDCQLNSRGSSLNVNQNN